MVKRKEKACLLVKRVADRLRSYCQVCCTQTWSWSPARFNHLRLQVMITQVGKEITWNRIFLCLYRRDSWNCYFYSCACRFTTSELYLFTFSVSVYSPPPIFFFPHWNNTGSKEAQEVSSPTLFQGRLSCGPGTCCSGINPVRAWNPPRPLHHLPCCNLWYRYTGTKSVQQDFIYFI